jgi:hypothetical protein
MSTAECLEEREDWKSPVTISVPYSSNLKRMLELGGHHPHYSILEANFSLEGEYTRKIIAKLVGFNRPITSYEAAKELNLMGLRPCTTEELIAFGGAYGNFQKSFLIIALGSSIHYNFLARVPVLTTCSDGQCFDLRDRAYTWKEVCKFLVTPLQTSPAI